MNKNKITAFENFCKRRSKLEKLKQELKIGNNLLVQAKALALSPLPYRKSTEPQIERTIRVGKHTHLSVTYAALKKGVPLPYGKDRALLGWAQTLAKRKPETKGFVMFESLTKFFQAFGLPDDGTYYRWFQASLRRITNFAVNLSMVFEGRGELIFNQIPIKKAFLPSDPKEARDKAFDEHVGQLALFNDPYQHKEFGCGFQRNKDFREYLKENPMVMPFALMKRFHNKPKMWDFASLVFLRCGMSETESLIPWEMVLGQMASKDTNSLRLKRHLREQLRELHELYPDCPAVFIKQGLLVGPWRWMDHHTAWPEQGWLS